MLIQYKPRIVDDTRQQNQTQTNGFSSNKNPFLNIAPKTPFSNITNKPTPSPSPPKTSPFPTNAPAKYPTGQGYSYVTSSGQPVYQLPSGETVSATEQARQAITQGATTASQVQQPRTIVSQLSQPSSGNAVITPLTQETTFISRKQAGAEKPFFSTLGKSIGVSLRSQFNLQTSEDIGFDFSRTTKSKDIKIRNIPTGTVINPSSGIKEFTTTRERAGETFITQGFYIPTGVKQETMFNQVQTDYNKGLNELQSGIKQKDIQLQTGIDTRTYSVEQARQIQKDFFMSSRIKAEELKATASGKVIGQSINLGQDYNKNFKFKQQTIQEMSGYKTTSLQPFVDIGTNVAVGELTGGGAWLGMGAVKIQQSLTTKDMTIKQRIFGLGLAALDVYAATSTISSGFKAAGTAIQKASVESSVSQFTKQGVKFGEAGEIRITKELGDISAARMSRTIGDFTQRTEVTGLISKGKDTSMFIGKGAGTKLTTGFVESPFKGGTFGITPKFYTGAEAFTFGSKGTTIPISETMGLNVGGQSVVRYASTSALMDLGKIGSQGLIGFNKQTFKTLGKNVKFKLEGTSGSFGAVTGRIGENLYLTKSGKLDIGYKEEELLGGKLTTEKGNIVKAYGYKPAQLNVDILAKDYLVTRTIPSERVNIQSTFGFSQRGGSELGQLSRQRLVGQGVKESVLTTQISGIEAFKPPKISSFVGGGKGQGQSLGFGTRNILKGFQTTQMDTQLKTSGALRTNFGTGFSMNQLSLKTRTSLSTGNVVIQGLQTRQLQGQMTKQMQDFSFKTPTTSLTGGGGFMTRGSFTPRGPGFAGFGIPQLGGDQLFGQPRRKKKKKKPRVAPSFTAEVFNIVGKLPKSGAFGISPFQIRKIPRSMRFNF